MTDKERQVNAQVGHVIDTYLKWRRLTRSALAHHLGIADTTLRQKIKGYRPWSLYELQATAQLLGIPLNQLIEAIDHPDEPPMMAELVGV